MQKPHQSDIILIFNIREREVDAKAFHNLLQEFYSQFHKNLSRSETKAPHILSLTFATFLTMVPLQSLHTKFELLLEGKNAYSYFDGIGEHGELLLFIYSFNSVMVKKKVDVYCWCYFNQYQYKPHFLQLFTLIFFLCYLFLF